MPKRSTLLREVKPVGPITRSQPIPVLVHLRYTLPTMGDVEEHPAQAVAWTRGEVLVRWDGVEAWLPASDVRRV